MPKVWGGRLKKSYSNDQFEVGSLASLYVLIIWIRATFQYTSPWESEWSQYMLNEVTARRDCKGSKQVWEKESIKIKTQKRKTSKFHLNIVLKNEQVHNKNISLFLMIAHHITALHKFPLIWFLMICSGIWLHSVNKILSGLENIWNIANSAYYFPALLIFLPQYISNTIWQHNSQDKYSPHLCVTVQLDQ